MSFAFSIEKQIASLVHPSVLPRQAERLRHETFILRRLASSVTVMCLAPLFLAIYGAPVVWHALVFVWCIVPIGAVLFLSRSGDLLLAQAICIVSFVGAATTIAAGGGPWEAALVWLVLAPFEGVLSQNFRLVLSAGVLSALAALGLTIADRNGIIHTGFATGHAPLLVLPAIIYATLAAHGLVSFQIGREKSARLRTDHYRAVYDTLDDLIIHQDRNGVAEFISPNCLAFCGLPAADLMGRGLFEHIHVADRPAFLKAISDAAAGPHTIAATLRLRALTGQGKAAQEPSFRWVELRARRFAVDSEETNARPDRVVSILRDITQFKQREQAYETARATAEEANAWKDKFLANVSHELRTPLNAIIGFSEILADQDLSPQETAKQREYAAIIQKSGQHLLAVVNSILDMSKIQSGAFDLRPEPFALPPLIDLSCDMVKLKATEGGVELVRAYPEKIDDIVGDKRAYKQILLNLLSNAIKFTPRGGRVTVKLRPDGNHIVVSVADTGIGIAPNDLVNLGCPFFQAGASYDRPYEGTGLGLSVVRGLVGLHGGTIAIESELNQGTCVSVRLPLDCRRLPASKTGTAKIETLPRRSRSDDPRLFSNEMMVKKIA
ncbi:PAS domain-containing sensor histidine kinase [uncultured Methylovirgula sp.]|uniref:PAS domain-containing sensor histidine kinase n=1 Tax=uncultured Methylovirgula sp. TaxID=1285960 RepID=UPI00262F9A86|nr:PAS domain-containing sensor histidine kinase [uncultured Methylovirgula sp.]